MVPTESEPPEGQTQEAAAGGIRGRRPGLPGWARQLLAPRCCRDAALFAVAAAAAAAASALCSGHPELTPARLEHTAGGAARGEPPASGGIAAQRVLMQQALANVSSPYAYVQMAYDAPDGPPSYIWRSLAMARALQRVSAYPLILLSNVDVTGLSAQGNVAARLARLNAFVVPVQEVYIPGESRESAASRQRRGFWKLQIWRLTQFRRLIWLDTDAILVRSLDWLFERPPILGEGNRGCQGGEGAPGSLAGGVLLIQPNESIFEGLQRFAVTWAPDWQERGVDGLVQDYFAVVLGQPVRLLPAAEAAPGACLGSAPRLACGEEGPFSMPAFVHRSSAENECFYFDRTAQIQHVNGSLVNVCHLHPLGVWWRSLFCAALSMTEFRDDVAEDFCDDDMWYNRTGR